MDALREIRLKELDGLKEYTNKIECNAFLTLQSIGWDLERIEDNKDTIQCPFDHSHVIKMDKFQTHVERCKLTHLGYRSDDLFLPDNSNLDVTSSIVLGQTNVASQGDQTNYYPNTLDRIVTTFTRDERLKMYDYVIANTRPPAELREQLSKSVQLSDDIINSKSTLEEQALNRDLKRRRMKYKVSTKLKTYTEVMREVIDNQMLEYMADIKCQYNKEKVVENDKHDYNEDLINRELTQREQTYYCNKNDATIDHVSKTNNPKENKLDKGKTRHEKFDDRKYRSKKRHSTKEYQKEKTNYSEKANTKNYYTNEIYFEKGKYLRKC